MIRNQKSMARVTVVTICLFLAIVGFVSSTSAADFQLLLNAGRVSAFSPYMADESVVMPDANRSIAVDLNPVLANSNGIATGDTLHLNLFFDAIYTALVDRVTENINKTVTVRGRIKGHPLAYVIITTTGKRSLAEIDIPEKNQHFVIQSDVFGSHILNDISGVDAGKLENGPSLIPPVKPMRAFSLDYSAATAGSLDPATVDVMIVYTPAARIWAGGTAGIANIIAQAMQKGQDTCDNSNTMLTLRLIHSAEVEYTENGSSVNDLYRLTDPADGYMDEVHTLRNQYSADIVTLLAKVEDTGGISWLLNSTSGLPDYAFNLCRVQQSSWTFTVVHEQGHNMGCGHHKAQTSQPGPGLFSYSAGGRWTGTDGGRYCSVMTYESGSFFPDGITHTRVAHWSNPSISYAGVPTGDAVNADNARSIREIKHVIAAYRTPAPTIVNITPNIAQNNSSVSISDIAGSGFISGATVKLRKTGQEDIDGTDVTVVSATKITCSFDLTGKAPGIWEVVVTNPDAQSASLQDAFTILGRYTLSSVVHLGDYNASPDGIPVQVELLTEAGATVRTVNTTLDASGMFHVTDVEPGTYMIAIKPSHWLRKVTGPVTVVDTDVVFVIE